ncbi:MAG: DUF3795 domain-containing protein [Candidatus Bipolaricaulota bacterium]
MGHREAAVCGDWCGKCPHFGGRCLGCIPLHHLDCTFVRCTLAKYIEHCGLCADFPCPELREFVPDDRPGCPAGYHIDNLRDRMAQGTEAWIAEQRAAWPAKEGG